MDNLRQVYDLRCPGNDNAESLPSLELFLYFFNPSKDLGRMIFWAGLAPKIPALTLPLSSIMHLRSCAVETYLCNDLVEDDTVALLKFLCSVNRFERRHTFHDNFDKYYRMIARELHGRLQHTELLRECMCSPLANQSLERRALGTRYRAFSLHILTDPDLSANTEIMRACANLDMSLLCETCPVIYTSKGRSGSSYLGNLIAITRGQVVLAGQDLQGLWMKVISTQMNSSQHSVPDKINFSTPNAKTPSLGSYTVDVSLEDSGDAHSVNSPVWTDHLSDFTRGEIEALYSPKLVRSLLSSSLTTEFAEYVNALLLHYPKARDPLLLELTLIATEPTASFNLLVQAYQDWMRIQDEMRHSDIPAGLIFYLEVFSRTMLTMVDDEFFDPERNPVPLDIVQDTAEKLKSLVYHSFTGTRRFDCLRRDSPHLFYLQNLFSKVLQQIQTRDSRQQFLQKDFFIYHDKIDMQSVVQIVAAEAYPADFDLDEDEDEAEGDTVDESAQKSRGSTVPIVQLLNACPFFVPFFTRVEILQTLIVKDTANTVHRDYFDNGPKHYITCRRGNEFEDGFESLWNIGGDIKGVIRINYLDVHGTAEAGIDGGGLTKEFLTSVCSQAFHPDFGLFVETPERLLYPNPASSARTAKRLQQYEFLGRIIAKCIFEEILVDVAFAPFFLLNWIGKLAYIDDLKAMDKDLYHGLIQLKHYTGDVENDFALDFTINEEDSGRQRTIDLLPNGAEIAVTKTNRLQYIQLVCNFKLNSRLSRQSQAFVRGLSDVLDLRWLSLFNQNEMQSVVGGAPVPINISDLKEHTAYGGFDENDVTVRIFWDVLAEFDNEERRKLLKFVTSTPRPPLLGFKDLQPSFALRNAGSDVERLPTASTCVNLLKLPAYQSHEQMRRKLRLSITAEAGFDLS